MSNPKALYDAPPPPPPSSRIPPPSRRVADLCQHWSAQAGEERVTLAVTAAVLARCVHAADFTSQTLNPEP